MFLFAIGVVATLAWWSASGATTRAAAPACETEQGCRDSLNQAVQRAETCLWSCADEADTVKLLQERLTRMLEAEAEATGAERQRSFDARRSRELERQRELAWQREKEAQAIAHRQKLELVAARAASEREAEQARAERQVQYLRQLTPEQRSARLERCRLQVSDCDGLAALLIRAADSAEERRALVEQNEAPPLASPHDAS